MSGNASSQQDEWEPAAVGTGMISLHADSAEQPMLRVLPRPDASFLTHLIATAQHSPQTRTLRRASSADANAAYRSTAIRDRVIGARPRRSI
ncbi:MAG: hypothetical protein EWM45_02325 [Rhodopseudomonas palustris]|nr:MAG: hypothetical protein EWM45_02325 [Rhodopseudomonas palustris]